MATSNIAEKPLESRLDIANNTEAQELIRKGWKMVRYDPQLFSDMKKKEATASFLARCSSVYKEVVPKNLGENVVSVRAQKDNAKQPDVDYISRFLL